MLSGYLLVADDLAQPSDAIIVIGGDHKPERVRHAVEKVSEGSEQLPEAEVMRRQALALGLPEEAMLVEEESRSTFENAYYSRLICRQYGFDSILLATSKFHSGRAKRIFQDVLGTEITIRVQPAISDTCSICWIFDPSQVYVVFYEYWNWFQYWANDGGAMHDSEQPTPTLAIEGIRRII